MKLKITIEGLPGTGKEIMARTIASVCNYYLISRMYPNKCLVLSENRKPSKAEICDYDIHIITKLTEQK